MLTSQNPFNPRMIGLSPLGTNLADERPSLPVGYPYVMDSDTPREVPLVFDSITGTYCAPLDKTNQEERLQGLEVARLTNEDQRFLGAAGFIQK